MNTILAAEDILLRIIGITNNNIKKICKINEIDYEKTIVYMKNFIPFNISNADILIMNNI